MGQRQQRESCSESRGSNVHDGEWMSLPTLSARKGVQGNEKAGEWGKLAAEEPDAQGAERLG